MFYFVIGIGVFITVSLLIFIYFKILGLLKGLEEQRNRFDQSETIIKSLEERMERLERIFTSRSSGAAAEKLAENWLSLLPPERLAKNVRLGKGIVEFALKLRNGSYVPIDSKFFHLETIQSPSEVLQRVRERAREVTSYLKDEKAAGLGIMAVPQGIFPFLKASLFEELEKQGILIVSYEMLLPVCHLVYYLFEKEGWEEDQTLIFVKILEKELYHLEKSISQLLKEIKASETLALRIKESLTYLQKELERLKHQDKSS